MSLSPWILPSLARVAPRIREEGSVVAAGSIQGAICSTLQFYFDMETLGSRHVDFGVRGKGSPTEKQSSNATESHAGVVLSSCLKTNEERSMRAEYLGRVLRELGLFEGQSSCSVLLTLRHMEKLRWGRLAAPTARAHSTGVDNSAQPS